MPLALQVLRNCVMVMLDKSALSAIVMDALCAWTIGVQKLVVRKEERKEGRKEGKQTALKLFRDLPSMLIGNKFKIIRTGTHQ